jgi:hypothetical protein
MFKDMSLLQKRSPDLISQIEQYQEAVKSKEGAS